ncbi:MAG TPA: hypothetical protein VN750_21560 [Steroidobacteraceae bacterium]|nr:hypothetical protein [Steroidobacteraceae bacterium]
MSTVNTAVRALLCGVAATLATLTMSWSVVHSTATFPYASEVSVAHPAVTQVALQPRHQWFGQPAPAVLVD